MNRTRPVILALVALAIEIPDGTRITRIGVRDLPPGWRRAPGPPALAEIGDGWIREGRTAVMAVPSAIIPEEAVGVLNPNHPEFAGVRMGVEREFHYDLRMFARRAPRANV